MNCEDARPWLSSRRSGQIALTEWALGEVHLRQCARCREEDARLQQQRPEAHSVTASRAALASIRDTMEVTRSLTGSTAARGHSLLMAVATEAAPRVIAGLVQAASLGIGYWAGLMPRLRAVPAIALALLARATARQPDGPRPAERPPAPEPQPSGLQPAPPDQPRAVAHPSPRARVAQVPGRSAQPLAPVFAPVAAGHVVGRLSVKDRSAAERELSVLLGEVEGTEFGRIHHPRFTAVQVTVPHRRYREFTHGLTHVGLWRLEATGFSLPDSVHVTIRVSE